MTQLLSEILNQPIHLEAVSRSRNIARRYAIEASRDLFGVVIIEYGWGRIGTRGQSRIISFGRDDEAERFVRRLLVRRAGAKRRIGVTYCRAV
jgi:predicted DNA-binding WGR domain protein